MFKLIGFELKKMLTRRVAIVVNICVLLMLIGIMSLNVIQTKTTDLSDNVLSGTDAIAYLKQERQAHAGTLTPEKVASDIADYKRRAFEKIDPEQLLSLSSGAAYDLLVEAYGLEGANALLDPYYQYLLSPWDNQGMLCVQTAATVDEQDAAGFYDAVAGMVQDKLDDGHGGAWVYSDAERAYWTDMQAGVSEPLEYGWAEGWGDMIDCAAFLAFAMFAICVTLAPLFASEYQNGTDAVLLASRFGRSRLVAAKLLAALLYATVYFALSAGIICGVALAFFGAEGFSLPVQVLLLASPCGITAGQAALIMMGLYYLATLGIAALTMALSSFVRSQLAIISIDIVLLFLAGMVPTGSSGFLTHLFAPLPINFGTLPTLYGEMISYDAGFAVLGLAGVVALVYAVLAGVSLPLSAVCWRRHQVM